MITENARKYTKNRCKEQSCEMKIGRHISQNVIVDVEKYWIANRKRGNVSDCLILCTYSSRTRLAIVELKGRSPDVGTATKKIQNVCNLIKEFLEVSFLSGCDFDFYPILLSKGMGSIETKKLRASRIQFQHQAERIIRENCNVSLEYIFKKYG